MPQPEERHRGKGWYGDPEGHREAAFKNPNFFRRKQIQYTPRDAKIIKNNDGSTTVLLPDSDYNQIAMKVKDPLESFKENGIEDWELPSGQVLVGSINQNRPRPKIPIDLPHNTENSE